MPTILDTRGHDIPVITLMRVFSGSQEVLRHKVNRQGAIWLGEYSYAEWPILFNLLVMNSTLHLALASDVPCSLRVVNGMGLMDGSNVGPPIVEHTGCSLFRDQNCSNNYDENSPDQVVHKGVETGNSMGSRRSRPTERHTSVNVTSVSTVGSVSAQTEG
nr:hypothetical protein [Tanacetum cinerariifolium]